MLLGLLRDDKALTDRFLRSHAPVESIRKQIDSQTIAGEKITTSVDLTLSSECKRVLAFDRPCGTAQRELAPGVLPVNLGF